MTIAISLTVHDGIVLATDSASTMVIMQPDGTLAGAQQVYNNANKIFNLKKGYPIGAITWGCGSIGAKSISTLVKDFRQLLDTRADWIETDGFQVRTVVEWFRGFVYDEQYLPAFQHLANKPALGLSVSGFSGGADEAESYRIEIDNQGCRVVELNTIPTLNWYGMIHAVNRLMLGFDPAMTLVLTEKLAVPPEQIPEVLNILVSNLHAPVLNAAMPIQDAIDLAEFLVHTAIGFTRFMPGAPSVGGPIEVASITKHEGFKWIRRKHYYSLDLNPKE